MLDTAEAAGAAAIKGMEDTYPCGGAYIIVDGSNELVKLFKKYGAKSGEGANAHYKFGKWGMSKNYPTGFTVSCYGNGGYQNMDMHSAENNAYVRVFGLNNIPVRVHTYID